MVRDVTLLAFIMLTALDGSPIWVDHAQVQIIRPATQQCKTHNASGIQVSGKALCVRETPAEIQEKIRKAEPR